ncbi:Os05g0563900, partial [Oryza sativa Japonica Group]
STICISHAEKRKKKGKRKCTRRARAHSEGGRCTLALNQQRSSDQAVFLFFFFFSPIRFKSSDAFSFFFFSWH